MKELMMKINAKTFNTAYYVYTYSNDDGLLYAGCGTLRELISFKDIRHHPDFKDAMIYEVNIISGPIDDKAQAFDGLKQFIRHQCGGVRPPFNYGLLTHKGRKMPVVDTATGTVYDSATSACQAHGIAPSRMSAHLNGYKGHKTINGRVFVYERTPEGQSLIHESRRKPLATVPQVDNLTPQERQWWEVMKDLSPDDMTREQAIYRLYLSGKIKGINQ